MRTLSTIILLVALANSAIAKDQFSSQEQFSKWLTYYYLNPEPNRVASAVRYMSESGALNNAKVMPPIFGFLSGVIASKPSISASLLNSLNDIPENHYGVVILGVWYSNLPNSQEEVYRALDGNEKLNTQFEYLRKGKPMALHTIPLEQGPWVLDALWGDYSATGNAKSVERISEALEWSEIKGDIGRLLVGGAAKWSLSSNAAQHKRVKEILLNLSNRYPDNKHLKEVLARAAEYEKNGANK
jgi:hypothetical protein